MRMVFIAVALLATMACTGPANEQHGAQATTVANAQQKPTYQDITASELYSKWQEAANKTNAVLLDVRTPKEWNEGHLQDARHINFYDSNFKAQLQELDKAQTYYVYCKSGGRSGKTAKLMTEMGFTKVYNVEGGITSLKATQFTLVNE